MLRAVYVLSGVAALMAVFVVAWLEFPTRRSCGIEPSAAHEVLVIAVSGRRWNLRPDVLFDPKAYGAHANIFEVTVPAGDRPVRVVLAATHDLVLDLEGALDRVTELRSYQGKNHVAVVGLDRQRVTFSQKPACQNLLLQPFEDSAHVHQVKVV